MDKVYFVYKIIVKTFHDQFYTFKIINMRKIQ